MNKKILLLDEDQIRRNNTNSRLRTHGFDPELAEGGFHVLHLIEKFKFGAVVIFGNSHDMSGLEIITLARVQFKKDQLPIIYIHRGKNQEDIIEAFTLGANEVIIQTTKYFAALIDRLNKLSSK